MNKKCIWKICTALLAFVIMLGAGLFYLRYEGIINYQYVVDPSPDLSLSVDDAAEVIKPQNLDYVTEYNLDHVLVYKPQIPVAVVRVIFSELPEKRMNATVSFIPKGQESEEPVVRLQDNELGSNEILFTFPKVETDEMRITVHNAADVQRIEMYENSAYVDESKQVPHVLNRGIAVLLAVLLAMACLASEADIRSGKGFAFPALHLILEIAVLSFCLQTRKYEVYSQSFEIVIYAFLAAASMVLCIVYRMLFIWHTPLHWMFAVGSVTMGIIMMLLIQPFTVPDEETHFRIAYRKSNIMMGASGEDEAAIRWEDLRFKEKQTGEYGTKNSYERYLALARDFTFKNGSEGIKRFGISSTEAVPLGYVATSMAISAARMLDFSGMMLFYFGRFVNLLVFVALITLSIYLIPFGKAAVACIAMAPVAMQQAASYSYDPVVTALAFLYVSYVLRLWAQEKLISPRQFALCCLLGILLAPSKISYAPMTAVVFLIPAKKYAFGGKWKWMINFSVVIVSFAALFASQLSMISLYSKLGDVERAAQVTQTAQVLAPTHYSLEYVLSNIREILTIYLHTFERGMDSYIPHLFAGLLGWLDLSAYGWVSGLLFILFVLGTQYEEREPQVFCTAYLRIGVIIAAMGAIIVTMLSMLLANTYIGSYTIQGVQGRYFIPVMIMLIPILRNSQIQIKESAIRWCGFAALWTSLFAVVTVLQNMPRLLIFA